MPQTHCIFGDCSKINCICITQYAKRFERSFYLSTSPFLFRLSIHALMQVFMCEDESKKVGCIPVFLHLSHPSV